MSEEGLYGFSRYFIVNGQLRSVFHTKTKLPQDRTPDDIQAYASSFLFTLGNHLDIPNAEDELELELALNEAYNDGAVAIEK